MCNQRGTWEAGKGRLNQRWPGRCQGGALLPCYHLQVVRQRFRPGLTLFALLLAVIFDLFRLFIVDVRHGIPRVRTCVDEFVDLGVQRLCIPMGGPLDEQSYEERGDRHPAVPIQRLRLNNDPGNREGDRCDKGAWMGKNAA